MLKIYSILKEEEFLSHLKNKDGTLSVALSPRLFLKIYKRSTRVCKTENN